jgi:hypothetical protein
MIVVVLKQEQNAQQNTTEIQTQFCKKDNKQMKMCFVLFCFCLPVVWGGKDSHDHRNGQLGMKEALRAKSLLLHLCKQTHINIELLSQ